MILEIDAAPDHVFRIPPHPVSVGFCLTADYNDLLQSSQDAILAPGDLRHRMSISLYHPGRKQRWLLLVLAIVFQGNVVSADSLSSPAFDAEAHAKVCKCGPLCRHASCCCGWPSVLSAEIVERPRFRRHTPTSQALLRASKRLHAATRGSPLRPALVCKKRPPRWSSAFRVARS